MVKKFTEKIKLYMQHNQTIITLFFETYVYKPNLKFKHITMLKRKLLPSELYCQQPFVFSSFHLLADNNHLEVNHTRLVLRSFYILWVKTGNWSVEDAGKYLYHFVQLSKCLFFACRGIYIITSVDYKKLLNLQIKELI